MAEKSTNLLILDTKEKIIAVLEDAHLPVTVMQYILADVTNTVNTVAKNIIEKDRENYYKELEKEREKKDGVFKDN